MVFSWTFVESSILGKAVNDSENQLYNAFFKKVNDNSALRSRDYENSHGGVVLDEYNDIMYVDLNGLHNPDMSFTIEFRIKEIDMIMDKPVNYLTFGYHIRGTTGTTLTVGRPAGSDKVVLGTISDQAPIKASPNGDFPTVENTYYSYALVYNHYATDAEKIKLYRGYDLICSSDTLNVKNFSISDPKLFFGSSMWTNELEWEYSFDLAKIVITDTVNFFSNRTVDKTFIPGSPHYPIHIDIKNATDATRNSKRVAAIGDTVHIEFHSSRDVGQLTVSMDVQENLGNVPTLVSYDPNYVVDDKITRFYSFGFTVTDTWPVQGTLDYALDFYGTPTVSNIIPDISANIYIDKSTPSMTYSIGSPSATNLSFVINSITDNYYEAMNLNNYENNVIVFNASNENHFRSLTIKNPLINQTYFLDNLLDETVYSIYGSITDVAQYTSNDIKPTTGSSIIETIDITKPIINIHSINSIKDTASNAGINVSLNTYDTAARNFRLFDHYIAILKNENQTSITNDYIKSKAQFTVSLSNNKTTDNDVNQDFYTFYDVNTNQSYNINPEETYEVYCLSIDTSNLQTVVKNNHHIENTLYFDRFYSDFSDDRIAQNDNILTLEWHTDYQIHDTSIMSLKLINDSITSFNTTDKLNWTATQTVNSQHPIGFAKYSLTHATDGQTNSRVANYEIESSKGYLEINQSTYLITPTIYYKSSSSKNYTYSGWFNLSQIVGYNTSYNWNGNPGSRLFMVNPGVGYTDGSKAHTGIYFHYSAGSQYTVYYEARGDGPYPNSSKISQSGSGRGFTLNYNEWALFTYVSSDNGLTTSIYVNGTLIFNSTGSSLTFGSQLLVSYWNINETKMSINNPSGSQYVKGKFSNFAFWNSSLTQANVSSLYETGNGWNSINSLYNTNNIAHYWSFDGSIEDHVGGKHFTSTTVNTYNESGGGEEVITGYSQEADKIIYIQNVPPAITGNVTFGSTTTQIVVNTIANHIHDFTVNSNNNLIKLDVNIGDESFSQLYSDKSLIPSTITLDNLAENTSFDVFVSLSNVFQQSNNILVGNKSTLSDFPDIVLNTTAVSINNEPVIQLGDTSTLSELTTNFEFYVEATNYDIVTTDNTTIKDFFLNKLSQNLITKRGENIAPGTLLKMNDYMNNNITDSFVHGVTNKQTISPSSSYNGGGVFYVYGMIYDQNHYIVTSNVVSFDFSLATFPVINNTSYDYFVRHNDTVEMEWSTKFKSTANNFTNLKLLNIDINPTSTDSLNWKATITTPSDGTILNTNSLSYITNTITNINSDNIHIDTSPPTFSLSLNDKQSTAISIDIKNVSDTYNTYTVPQGVNNLYKIDLVASNNSGSITTSNIVSYDNIVSTLTLDNLEESTQYQVYCTITDPANNSNTVLYSSGNLIKTNDVTAPVLSSTDFGMVQLTNYEISFSNIKAYDIHSSFDLYVGLFDTQEQQITMNTFNAYKNSEAIVYKNFNSGSTYQSFSNNVSSILSWNGISWSTSFLVPNATYYAYGVAQDAEQNVNTDGVILLSYIDTIDLTPDTLNEAVKQDDPTELTIESDTRIVYEEVVDEETGKTTYVGTDYSGNNNSISITPSNTEVSPLSDDGVVNSQSLDLGKVENVTISSDTLQNSEFTYSSWFKNKNIDYSSDVVLLQSDNFVIKVSSSGITIESGIQLFYPIELDTNEWTSVVVSHDSINFKLSVNGVELYPSSSEGTFVQPTGTLTIPKQNDILIDDTRFFSTVLDEQNISKINQAKGKSIHLSFDSEGYVFDYDVTMPNENIFLLNNSTFSSNLILNKNGVYTFYQTNTTNTKPLVFSYDGTYENVINDNDEVTYYANNQFLGNDPLQYILKFNKSISQRKVVFRPNTLSNVFYNTIDTSINPINVLVSTNEPVVYNMVDIQNNPTYTVTPLYSEDTPIGKFAMVFDDSKQHSLTFDNMSIDANNLTLSTWVNMSEFKLDKNPIISQENIFEFGVDNTGKPYLNILNGENPKDYISSVGTITYNDNSFVIDNIVVTPDNPTYFYYIATVNKMTKKEIMSLIDQYKQTNLVSMDILTTETLISSKTISYILDANNSIQSVSSVDSGYVYISARNSQEDYTITMLNDFKELSLSISNTLPYIKFIDYSQSNNTRIIESASLYHNSVIDKYYIFSFELSTATSSSLTYNVNASSGSYVFTGDSTGTYPTLSIYTGDTLTFNVSVSGHPFWIKSQANVTGSQYALTGIFNNGAETGSIVWTPDTSGTFYYQCGYHSGMNGEIIVNDHIFKNNLTDSNISAFIDTLPPNLPEGMNSIFNGTNNIYVSGNNPNQSKVVLDISNIQLESAFTSFTNTSSSTTISSNKNYVEYIVTINPLFFVSNEIPAIEILRNLESFGSSQPLTIGTGGLVKIDSLSLNKDGTVFVSTVSGNTAHLYNKVNNTFVHSHTFNVLDSNERGCGQSLSLNGLHFITTSWTSSELRILSRASLTDNFENFIDFNTSHFTGITNTISTGATFIGDDGEYVVVYFYTVKKLRLYTRVDGNYVITKTFDINTYSIGKNEFFRIQSTYLINDMAYLAVGDYGKPFTLYQLSNISTTDPSLLQIKTIDDPDDGAGDSHGLSISGDGTVIIVGSHAQSQTGFFKYVNLNPSDVTGWSTSTVLDSTIATRGTEMSGDGSVIMYGYHSILKIYSI